MFDGNCAIFYIIIPSQIGISLTNWDSFILALFFVINAFSSNNTKIKEIVLLKQSTDWICTGYDKYDCSYCSEWCGSNKKNYKTILA